jgi:hypothetical protein
MELNAKHEGMVSDFARLDKLAIGRHPANY